MHRRRLSLLFVLVVVSSRPSLCAQTPAPAHPRPRLQVGADSADWLSYYQHGLLYLNEEPTESRASFWWATRLALALAAESQGDIAEARRSFARFLALASATDPLVLTARTRLAALVPSP